MPERRVTMTVAVLGTGTMGAAMAANIAAAGMGLRVWNRTREVAEPLTKVGAVVCYSAAEASQGADVVLTTLANEAITAEVMDKARTGFGEGTVWLQSCTVAPEGSRRLAEQADRLSVDYVEAPLLGTKEPAIAGTLTVLAASPQPDTRARVKPVLDAVGSRTLWLDQIGQPSALKLAYNAWVLATVEGIAESLTLAEALGVDPMLVVDVIAHSRLGSDYVQTKGPKMISDDLDTPSFPLQAAAKDAGLITDAAGLRLGIAETVRDSLGAAVRGGLGRADVAAVYRLSRRVTSS